MFAVWFGGNEQKHFTAEWSMLGKQTALEWGPAGPTIFTWISCTFSVVALYADIIILSLSQYVSDHNVRLPNTTPKTALADFLWSKSKTNPPTADDQ